MPIYDWKCSECECAAITVNGMDKANDPPEGGDCPVRPGEGHKWVKVIGAPTAIAGPNWRGGKGHWVLLVAALSAALTGVANVI
jgi:hypothetical protein